MTREQIENIYKANGLPHYKLNTTNDLLRVHGVDHREVEGYTRLDDINRGIYKTFIVNFYNAHGLEYRKDIIPKGIYFVEDSTFLIKRTDEDYLVVGSRILAIDRNGMKTVHTHCIFEKCDESAIIEEKPKTYLRFEYQQGYMDDGEPRMAWMHIVEDGYRWY